MVNDAIVLERIYSEIIANDGAMICGFNGLLIADLPVNALIATLVTTLMVRRLGVHRLQRPCG